MEAQWAIMAGLIAVLLCVSAASAGEAPGGRVRLWDEGWPFPSRESLSYPAGATDVMVHRSGSDGYSFLHDSAIIAHRGTLFAAWYNCPRREMVGESVIRGRRSQDGGRTWSDTEVIASDRDGQGVMYVPVAFLSHRNTLYAYITNMKGGPDLVHNCEVFVLQGEANAWDSRGSIAGPFIPNCTPKPMEEGNFIMAGRMADRPGQKPTIPAVAISRGEKLTEPWDLVRLLPTGKLPNGETMACPETTVLVDGKEITALVRHQAGNSLVFFSHDFGRTWSDPHEHNIPMGSSKIWAGKLSTGQRYLIFNYNTGRGRDLLAIAVSRPGEKTFSRMWKIRDGHSQALKAGPEWSYPCATEFDGKLWVVYTSEKHHCALTVIPLQSLATHPQWPSSEGCKDPSIAQAMEAVRAAIPKAATDPTRPAYHFRPPGQWMNDICGALYHKGNYHVFYQLNPFGDIWGAKGSSWGHARSRDLVRWEHLPIAIVPSTDRGELRCNSGCVAINGQGTPMIFYTFVPEAKGRKREQWAAIACDDELLTWRKLDENPLMVAGRDGVPADMNGGWSDPFLFRAGGRTFATFKSSGGAVCEALNPELTKWKYAGRMDGVEGECPNFFPLQGRWVLLRSTYPPSYQVGRFDPEAMKFHMDGPSGTLDHAYGPKRPESFATKRGFYGTNVLFDDRGRCILFGWVSGFEAGRGWNGCMSLPRVLTLDDDGRPVQTPAPELTALRGKHIRVRDLTLNDRGHILEGVRGDGLEVLAELEPGTAKAVGLKLRRSDDGEKAIVLRYDGRVLDVAGTQVPLTLADKQRTLALHVFLDKSAMEVFINGGRECVTRVMYPVPDALGVEVFAEGGAATARSIEVWQLGSIWQ